MKHIAGKRIATGLALAVLSASCLGLTFSAAGNIASAVTTTFANQVVRGVFNSTADKWYLYA